MNDTKKLENWYNRNFGALLQPVEVIPSPKLKPSHKQQPVTVRSVHAVTKTIRGRKHINRYVKGRECCGTMYLTDDQLAYLQARVQ